MRWLCIPLNTHNDTQPHTNQTSQTTESHITSHKPQQQRQQQPTHNNRQTTTGNQPPPTNHRQTTTEIQQPTDNNRHTTTDKQQPTKNDRPTTTGKPQPTTENTHGNADRRARNTKTTNRAIHTSTPQNTCKQTNNTLPRGWRPPSD